LDFIWRNTFDRDFLPTGGKKLVFFMEQRFFAQWQKLANPAYCQLYLPDKILNPRF